MLELVLQVGFSLLVVFGLMWGLAKAVKRPLGGNRHTGTLAVLNRQQLTRGAAIAVIQAGEKALVVGVTDQQVSLLSETDLIEFQKPEPAHETRDSVVLPSDVIARKGGRLDGSMLSPRTWKSTIDFLRERTTRH